LATLLRNDDRFDARLSRPTPNTQLGVSNTTSLAARVNDANSWGADYYISLHTNASDISSASGSEAFAYSRNSEGFVLGERILFWLNNTTGLANRGVFARPGLYILRKTQMPSVLVELGFITNPRDASLMNTRPDLFAQGIYRGIVEYTGV
jgi:N-acetylmuramoyl-L-alanine amidase